MINNKQIEEKRKYLRVNAPLEIEYLLPNSNKICKAVTKDISAAGVRFSTNEKMPKGSGVELTLRLPKALNPVHASGKIAWLKKAEDKNGAFSDIGIEFTKIEEDNKNTFVKYLCDLIYG